MVDQLVAARGIDSAVEMVSIGLLVAGDSPRLDGASDEHSRLLADSNAVLPPIVVQRSSMRVVDGVHRLRAAILRGDTQIRVRFFEGDDDSAFILAVESNVAHGLPLSQADRMAAVARIVVARPEWSDRKVAAVAGVSWTSVGAVRRRSSDQPGQLNAGARIGRDGRVRPVDQVEGRLLASELIKSRPEASIRQIAAAAGVSPATALDVRNRLRDGAHPVPDGLRASRPEKKTRESARTDGAVRSRNAPAGPDFDTVLHMLRKDPSLRFSEAGRALLRWLDAQTTGVVQWKQYVDNVPSHCVEVIAELARRNGEAWLEIMRYLEQRAS
ncbi:ParB/RepB/Spo0J family partition protein [Kutzneria sp. CA-103260]|uniref:ParB/RepB/Spo0J family partition protein n=1 Tax=Kutzneria sp. CA-103260 TaxID=2802641 RepID=UPI001BA7C2A8|nr:ParB/RepB/Spo0J family partition protein [Kutzneria sp. CA-103260]QUQ67059.1 streptomycin biosynthesis operon possible regulatory protein [Kutzneria sp. CA-103260]